MRALLLAACRVTTTSSDGPPRKRLRGAVREIGDVQDELVRSLKRGGFDLQMTGFGLMSTYHADNEFALLSDMSNGLDILVQVISQLEA